jgi:four helix bundle protein
VGKILHFRQLEVWQEAHKLVLMVYQVTNSYPKEEQFGLVTQMRRAAVSVPANIAEGFKWPNQKRSVAYSMAS